MGIRALFQREVPTSGRKGEGAAAKAGGGKTALAAGLSFIVPVWGVEYTRCFTELCLPTFLAPGNIPALPFLERHAFQIYTTPEDRAAIEASPAYRRLTQHMQVVIHRIRVPDPTKSTNRFSVQSDCFRRAIRDADALDRAMVFVTPDMILADGSLRNLAAIADRQGVRAVLTTGVRLVKESVSAHLLKHHRATADEPIVISQRELVRVLLENLHPIAKTHLIREDHGEGMILANLYWRAGAEGLVARCFYLHPFMVYPRVKNAEFVNTIDSDYVEAACPDLAESHIVTDSDEFCVCELSAEEQRQRTLPRNEPMAGISWMHRWTTRRHRTLVNTTIRIHTDMTDAALWQLAEQQAQADVTRLLSILHATLDGGQSTGSQTGYVEAAKASVPLRFFTALRDEGEAHAFADIALPSVVAPANIAAQVDKRYYAYKIVATEAARAVVESSPAFAELRAHIKVEVETRDAAAMQADGFIAGFRREASTAAGELRAAAVFIDPDIVLADNSLGIIRTALRSSMRAILVPRLRLRRTTAAPVLRGQYWIEGILSIQKAELVRLALDHLHPVTHSQFQGGDGSTDPTLLCWKAGTDGFLMHAFDLYPIAIYPRPGLTPAPGQVVDEPSLAQFGFSEDEVCMIRDTNAFVVCELREDDLKTPLIARRGLDAIAAWAAENTTSFHRRMFMNPIRIVTGEADNATWKAVEAKAEVAVRQILAAVARMAQRPPAAAARRR